MYMKNDEYYTRFLKYVNNYFWLAGFLFFNKISSVELKLLYNVNKRWRYSTQKEKESQALSFVIFT